MKNILSIIFLSVLFISCSKDDDTSTAGPFLPTLSTTGVTNIATTTARLGGSVSADGGSTVIVRGFCWGITTAPTILGSHSTETGGTGSFHSTITGLTPVTTYYVRGYATNGVGTSYGNQLSFITAIPVALLPSVTTAAVTSITSNTATSGGNVMADGGATVTARGVCWSTTTNPVATGSHSTNGTGTGVFVSSLTGLAATTTYYVRAYATNSEGTSYGAQVSFTTP